MIAEEGKNEGRRSEKSKTKRERERERDEQRKVQPGWQIVGEVGEEDLGGKEREERLKDGRSSSRR